MITLCNHCDTKFEISKELVESEDPRVRCGECLSVFDAKQQLVVEQEFIEPNVPTVTQKAVSQQAVPNAAVEVEGYISAGDLENADTFVLEDTAPAPQPIGGIDEFYSPELQIEPSKGPVSGESLLDTTTLEFERTLALDSGKVVKDEHADLAHSETYGNDPLLHPDEALDSAYMPEVPLQHPAVTDATIDDALAVGAEPHRDFTSTAQHRDSAMELRKHVSKRGGQAVAVQREANRQHQPVKEKSMLVPLLSCAIVLMGALYMARDNIARLDLPEPLLGAFCSVTGCELPVQTDVSRLELVRHKMNTHASLSDVLEINVDLINRAPFPQPYPVLSLAMTNQAGESVAERKFQPADYLEPDAMEQHLPSGKQVSINFEIVDPGPEAITSTLVFE